MQWEIDAATGSDNNGGGFDDTSGTPGTNYAWGAGQTVISWLAAAGTYTNDLASTSASGWLVLTSASRNFAAADVGNVINITAGTNFTAGRYQIVSVAANAATLDRACGATANASAGSGYLGGALASVFNAFWQNATAPYVADNKIWLKGGSTYTRASALTVGKSAAIGTAILFSGYSSTHGDNPAVGSGNQPVFARATYATAMGAYWKVRNIKFTSATTTSNYLLTLQSSGGYVIFEECEFVHTATGRLIQGGTATTFVGCRFVGTPGQSHDYVLYSVGQYNFIGCYFVDWHATAGVVAPSTPALILSCIFDSCNVTCLISAGTVIANCTFVGCITAVSAAANGGVSYINNIFAWCNVGITYSGTTTGWLAINNNFYGNITATSNVPTSGEFGPEGGTANNPAFVTSAATGTDGATNSAPGTTFTSASANFSTVTTNDSLVVQSGTGATAGIYAIAAVAPGGDNTKLTLGSTPGNSSTAIKYAIIKGSTSTNLSLQAGSACLGAGYGIELGVG